MTRHEAIKKLKNLQEMDDVEIAHLMADDILVKFLNNLGYSDVTKEWDEVYKWYA